MATVPGITPSRTMATAVTAPPGVRMRTVSPLAMPSRSASSRCSDTGLCGCTWRSRETAIDMELIRLDLYEVSSSGHCCSPKCVRMALPSASRAGYQVGQPL